MVQRHLELKDAPWFTNCETAFKESRQHRNLDRDEYNAHYGETAFEHDELYHEMLKSKNHDGTNIVDKEIAKQLSRFALRL